MELEENQKISKILPILKKFEGINIKKVNSDSLSSIIAKARKMNKQISPYGCSQNLKAEFQDPEKALEFSKRKNRIFESYLQNELIKLNCSKSSLQKPKNKSHKNKSPFPIKLKENHIKPAQDINLSKKAPKKCNSPFSSKKDFSSVETFYKSNISADQIILPPLIKSIPLYLDPNYKFHKRNTSDYIARLESIKHSRMSSIEKVTKECVDFQPICRTGIQELERMQSSKTKQKKIISDYMEDFSDCLKMSKDRETFEDSLSTRIYNRKLDSKFKEELDQLKLDLLEVTKGAIDAGGKKIWRLKNTLFLANADRLINSVPSVRNN